MPKIEYDYEEKTGNILLPEGAPFDGNPVLIRLAGGWVEAIWIPSEEVRHPEGTEWWGFHWSCMDDDFQADLDDASEWMPVPNPSVSPTA